MPQVIRVIGGRAMAPIGKAEGGDGSGGTFLKQCCWACPWLPTVVGVRGRRKPVVGSYSVSFRGHFRVWF